MSFVWPQYLWLLLIVPVLVAAYIAVLRRKKVAVRYANLGLVKAAMGPRSASAVTCRRSSSCSR